MTEDAGAETTGPDEGDNLRLAREIAERYRTGATSASSPRGRKRRRLPSTARPHRADGVPLADIMGDLVRDQGWEESLASTRIFTEWATHVGPQVAQHCQVEHFTDGIVYVRTSSTAWSREITLLAPRLVAKLNEAWGDGTVLRIEARGPQAPSWKSGRRSVKGRGPRDTYG